MKRIAILGSTGSIGRSALAVVDAHPDRLRVTALAAGTANSIHLDGPGRIYIAGPNAEFLDLRLLEGYLQEMVKMSPLQGSYFEIARDSHDLALIGAATASRAR